MARLLFAALCAAVALHDTTTIIGVQVVQAATTTSTTTTSAPGKERGARCETTFGGDKNAKCREDCPSNDGYGCKCSTCGNRLHTQCDCSDPEMVPNPALETHCKCDDAKTNNPSGPVAQSAECQDYEAEKDVRDIDDCFEDKPEQDESRRGTLLDALIFLCVIFLCVGCFVAICIWASIKKALDKDGDGKISAEELGMALGQAAVYTGSAAAAAGGVVALEMAEHGGEGLEAAADFAGDVAHATGVDTAVHVASQLADVDGDGDVDMDDLKAAAKMAAEAAQEL